MPVENPRFGRRAAAPLAERCGLLGVTTLAWLAMADAASALTIMQDHALVTRSSSGSTLPSTRLSLSILDEQGKTQKIDAMTDKDGRLPVDFVPWNQWRADTAYKDLRLRLPTDGFGGIREYGSDGLASSSDVAFRDGNFIAPQRYALGLAAQYSLSCKMPDMRTDMLYSGARYSFEVPGDEASLKSVLGNRFMLSPEWYVLPQGGYGVSTIAGVQPQETWNGLKQLEMAGGIRYLEKDPCWKFLPEGAAPVNCEKNAKDFPDNAAHYNGDVAGKLTDTTLNTGLPDGYVRWGPISPTPYFNPGERPGDNLPPTYVMTGGDGSFSLPLNGYAGPIEINALRDCFSQSRVAIADGPAAPTIAGIGSGTASNAGASTQGPAGGTTTRPPAGSATTPSTTPPTLAAPPPSTPVASTPRQPRNDDRICGPDVTDHLLGALKLLEDTYEGWNDAERKAHCNVLYHPFKFNAAWDMVGFAPSDGGEPDPNSSGYLPQIFFQSVAPGMCAVPRWPCGATVQFMGYCIHAQVLNYVQWGAMNELCEDQVLGRLANLVRSGISTNYAGQSSMSTAGEDFAAFKGKSLDFRKSVMKRLLDQRIKEDQDNWYKMEGTDCALGCTSPGVTQQLDNREWGFSWRTHSDEIPVVQRGFQLKKP